MTAVARSIAILNLALCLLPMACREPASVDEGPSRRDALVMAFADLDDTNRETVISAVRRHGDVFRALWDGGELVVYVDEGLDPENLKDALRSILPDALAPKTLTIVYGKVLVSSHRSPTEASDQGPDRGPSRGTSRGTERGSSRGSSR